MEQSGEEEEEKEEKGEERERQRGSHTGAAHRSWDAVAAQRTSAAWEDLSLTTQKV